ncbi:MAG: helix-turn-helix domain-containing protein [Limnohabitans sp.]|nr:helix-turn-helix domain-containing protein [Limnohabitans sp.]
MAELGARLRARRLERNITTQMLAERTGLNRKTIMDLEAGRDVRLSTVMKVFRVLQLLANLNVALPDTLPGGQALSARGQPRQRAYRPSPLKTNRS